MYRLFRKNTLLLTITSLAFSTLNGCSTETKPGFDPVTMDLPTIDKTYPPVFYELFIASHGVMLTGFLLGANGAGPHPTVVLLHGYPGNEKNLDLAQSMRRAGFNVLFFHYRGAWGSQGDYALVHLAEDVKSALTFLRKHSDQYRVDTQKLSVVGHSMGGFTALRAGAQNDELVCVTGIAAANLGEYADRDDSARTAFKKYTDRLFMLNNFNGSKGLAEIKNYAQEFDVKGYGPKLTGKSVLLITGAEDTVVPPSVQQAIAQAYGQVPGLKLHTQVIPGDHAFSTNRIQLQRIVIAWLEKNCR